MLPTQLNAESFSTYPAQARELATKHIGKLQALPLSFVPLLLKELIVYDFKFPMERRDLTRQLRYLDSLSPEQFSTALAPFAQLRLSQELEKTDWVSQPAIFTEQLTAHLWTTHQIDAFRAAAVAYMDKATAAFPDDPLPTHRVGMVAIGQGVRNNDYRLFRKLRPHGTYFTKVNPGAGVAALVEAVSRRAQSHPEPYAHWYIDGGAALTTPPGISRISYGDLAPARSALQLRMQKTYEAPVWDPEAFRTQLAQTKPEEIGMRDGADRALNRFQLSLLTEGSGTQVFATTFTQWAAREALRRAQPLTMFTRFAPRQREKGMNELLAETQRKSDLDPQGSLVDADMGAYYTWLNQQRLPGAEKSNFLVWFEDHTEAVAVGPAFEPGKTSEVPLELAALAARLL
ncbi:MAG TPA: hypothetical protein VNH18_31935 [Bryobacteraceae bacterium]|nr:hypothetical protein [Bryobacteraceae bacterium]